MAVAATHADPVDAQFYCLDFGACWLGVLILRGTLGPQWCRDLRGAGT